MFDFDYGPRHDWGERLGDYISGFVEDVMEGVAESQLELIATVAEGVADDVLARGPLGDQDAWDWPSVVPCRMALPGAYRHARPLATGLSAVPARPSTAPLLPPTPRRVPEVPRSRPVAVRFQAPGLCSSYLQDTPEETDLSIASFRY